LAAALSERAAVTVLTAAVPIGLTEVRIGHLIFAVPHHDIRHEHHVGRRASKHKGDAGRYREERPL
jgi:hypothetical protein